MSVFRGENCALFAPSQVERKAMCFGLKLESIVDVKKQTSVGGHDGGGGGGGGGGSAVSYTHLTLPTRSTV